jgi:hypothetical protein
MCAHVIRTLPKHIVMHANKEFQEPHTDKFEFNPLTENVDERRAQNSAREGSSKAQIGHELVTSQTRYILLVPNCTYGSNEKNIHTYRILKHTHLIISENTYTVSMRKIYVLNHIRKTYTLIISEKHTTDHIRKTYTLTMSMCVYV